MREPSMPSGVVTFVLTDIVGSTPLWERVPATMAEALTRHDEIIAAAVAQHGGVLLRAQGEGDSTFSVFERATDALRAVHALQVGLGSERWPADTTIQVRAGVHSGEAVERDGDFVGTAVNRAARLRGLADGGEALVSAATAELVADHLPAGMQLVEAGEVRLRGLDRPESAFFLAASGLPAPRRLARPSSSTLTDRGVTRREADVLEALGERLTNAEIAARLYVSERTVESHVSSLLRKLEAGNRLELGQLAKDLVGTSGLVGPPLPAVVELLADPGTFVGRTGERERLRDLWRRASRGQTLMAVLAGEAGIGKSRLVAELAAEVHSGGGRVLLGSCFEDLQVPYQPFAQAITDDAAGLAPAEVRRRAGSTAVALARMVPTLAPTLGAAEATSSADGLTDRAAVFDALHRYLTATAAAAPTLLVVEDLHWASAGTRDVLRHLARRGGHAPLLIVATTRDAAPDLDDSLALVLADLAQLPNVDHLRLSGLRATEVTRLMEAIGSPAADPAAVLAETGGNPLLVREVATARDGEGAASLPSLLARRYERLEGADLATLDLAAILGAELEADLLAAAADQPLVEVLESLERIEGAGLVAPVPGRPGRFRFVHALFRTARYDDLPASRRLALHRQVAWALRDHSEDDRVMPVLAHHACMAAPLGEARTALQYASRAGELAERSLALDEAAALYRQGLAVADLLVPGEPPLQLGLSIRLGLVLNRMGDPGHRAVLADAAADARALGDAERLAEVAWAMSQDGTPTRPGRSDPEFVAIAEGALAALGPDRPAARARTLSALAADLMIGGDPQRAFQLASEALTLARAGDDPALLGDVLLATRTSRWVPGSSDAGHQTADELLDIGRATGRTTFTVHGLFERALACRERGDLDSYDEAVDALEALLDQVATPYSYLRVLHICSRSTRQAMTGDLAEAEATAKEVAPLAEAGRFDPAPWYGPGMAVIRHHQGRLAERLRGIEAAPEGFRDFAQPLLALAHAVSDSPDDARRTLGLLTGDGSDGGPHPHPHAVAGWVLACDAAGMTGDGDAGRVLARRLAPFSGLIAGVFSAAIAPVDLALAQASLAAGDAAGAEASAVRAIEASRRRATPIYLGRELLCLAAARRRRGVPASQTRTLVDEALGIVERTGAQQIRRDAARLGLVDPA